MPVACKRREFLVSVAVMMSKGTIVGALTGCGDSDSVAGRMIPAVEWPPAPASYVAEAWLDGAKVIGHAYLDAVLQRAGEEGYRAATEHVLLLVEPEASEAQNVQRLVNAVQEDFELGQIEVVAGWVVARTEAQICALIAVAG